MTTKTIKLALIAAVFGYWPIRASALEIPLKKGVSGGSSTIGFVDMEAIFQEFPETLKAKKEYYQQLKVRRQTLAAAEQKLAQLKMQPAASEPPAQGQATPPADVPRPSTPAASPALSSAPSRSGDWDDMDQAPAEPAAAEPAPSSPASLQEGEAALEAARLDAARELKEFEESRSLRIMGQLFKALVQLAEENGISLVVDKSSILYGQEAVDLTDKLRRKIRGLPEADQISQ